MKNTINFIIKERIIISILIIASILRFYDYQNRWGLAYDQAWFAVIARHSLDTLQIPLLGPFASGGPFQTGGEWFWLIIMGILLNPYSVISPWIFLTCLSVLQVLLLYLTGKIIINKSFGYLAAILGAFSTSQVLQATNLTNQMPTSFFVTIFILSIFKFIKERADRWLFIAGVCVGLTSALHLQGILVIPAVLVTVLVLKLFKIKQLFLIGFGVLLPWLPVLISDSQNHFYNTSNMLAYLTQPQNQVSYEMLGRRWLTFLGVFVPHAWARTIGGIDVLGYVQIILLGLVFVKGLWSRSIRREWWILAISTAIIFFCLRYIRTPLYENYITFLHPFILLLVSFLILNLIKINKKLGFIFLAALIIGSLSTTLKYIEGSTNTTAMLTTNNKRLMTLYYPNNKFAIFDYKYNIGHKSLPLVYYLQTESLLDDNGIKIGAVQASVGAQLLFVGHKSILGKLGEFQLYDLNSSSTAELKEAGWAPINPSYIYDSVQKWYKK